MGAEASTDPLGTVSRARRHAQTVTKHSSPKCAPVLPGPQKTSYGTKVMTLVSHRPKCHLNPAPRVRQVRERGGWEGSSGWQGRGLLSDLTSLAKRSEATATLVCLSGLHVPRAHRLAVGASGRCYSPSNCKNRGREHPKEPKIRGPRDQHKQMLPGVCLAGIWSDIPGLVFHDHCGCDGGQGGGPRF